MAQPIWMMLSGSIWRLIVSTCGPCAACQRQQKQPRSKVRSSSSSPPMIRHRLVSLSASFSASLLPTLSSPFSLSPPPPPLSSIQHDSISLFPSFLLPRCPLRGNLSFFCVSWRYEFKRTEKLFVSCLTRGERNCCTCINSQFAKFGKVSKGQRDAVS